MTLIIKLLAVAYSMIGTVTVHLKSSKKTNKQTKNRIKLSESKTKERKIHCKTEMCQKTKTKV